MRLAMRCPKCHAAYRDPTLRFCLADGTVLDLDPDVDEVTTVIQRPDSFSSQKTVAMDHSGSTAGSLETQVLTSRAPVGGEQSRGGLKAVLIIAGVAALALVIIVSGGIFYLLLTRPTPTPANANQANVYFSSVSPSPTPESLPAADDLEKLRDQIAELERLLEEREDSEDVSDVPYDIPLPSGTRPGRVNSPRDGFLALRSLPSTEIGERVYKIPHGATVAVGACGPLVRNSSVSGRWCQASYQSYVGWVFDAYLIY